MFAYIKGTVADVATSRIVLECAGIGYDIQVPATDAAELEESTGHEVKIHTYLNVSENGVALYGFLTAEELNFFKMLINVSGIGPKGALGILSAMTVSELRYAILAEDTRTISKAPGIGAKTAGKLVIELKDKVKAEDLLPVEKVEGPKAKDNALADAQEALVALGYSSAQALKAVNAAKALGYTGVEDLIKAALKQF
ncbi:MAG: Holliday junction branch migration protein RuvA [Lachnospiraceae bacterium]|nr:Holliday junction branch migration protein RuvA [Lachnospiraceae bacterium]